MIKSKTTTLLSKNVTNAATISRRYKLKK